MGAARRLRAGLLLSLLIAWAPQSALSQTRPYFQGKTINLIIAGTAGGGLDLSARIVARHFSRFIPGQPAMIAQLMPGAGGIRAVEYLSLIHI